jgi:hypothetical protein
MRFGEGEAREISVAGARRRSASTLGKRQRTLEASRRAAGLPEPGRPEPNNCECCGRLSSRPRRALALDHCHVTGKFRGWLCTACNLALGKLGDSIEGLERALAYLRRFEQTLENA